MKIFMAAISLLLFLLLFITVVLGTKAESSRGPYHPTDCCFSYMAHSVPHRWIRDYYKTSSECPKSGIVFITKKGHPICANPRDEWVRDYIKDLEES
uniref:C-C motif chemokine 14 n=1 Tax=Jaculus jaculus TaxID=51337 RepID=UPI000333321E|nr:C-C motif chemokine 14 [Jaculus jaculus]